MPNTYSKSYDPRINILITETKMSQSNSTFSDRNVVHYCLCTKNNDWDEMDWIVLEVTCSILSPLLYYSAEDRRRRASDRLAFMDKLPAAQLAAGSLK